MQAATEKAREVAERAVEAIKQASHNVGERVNEVVTHQRERFSHRNESSAAPGAEAPSSDKDRAAHDEDEW